MSRFIRKEAPLCACGCGGKVKKHTWKNKWNKFINGHQRRGKRFLKQFEKIPLCACGCGKEVTWRRCDSRWNKWVPGHHMKGINNPMKNPENVKKVIKAILALGKNNPCSSPDARAKKIGNQYAKGCKRSKETCQKISMANKGKNNGMFGKTHTKEVCKIISECQMGEKHHNWRGGISCEPYCDVWIDKEYKQSIRDRDNNKCQNPDCWKNCDHLPLTIHHINYTKKDCVPKNLITLCISCNSRANKNRKEHSSFYQNIINKKNTRSKNEQI